VRLLWEGLAFERRLTIGVYQVGRNVAVYLNGKQHNLVSGNFIIERADARELAQAILDGTAESSPEGA